MRAPYRQNTATIIMATGSMLSVMKNARLMRSLMSRSSYRAGAQRAFSSPIVATVRAVMFSMYFHGAEGASDLLVLGTIRSLDDQNRPARPSNWKRDGSQAAVEARTLPRPVHRR